MTGFDEIWSLTGNILAGVALLIVFWGFLSMFGSASVRGLVTETKDGNKIGRAHV